MLETHPLVITVVVASGSRCMSRTHIEATVLALDVLEGLVSVIPLVAAEAVHRLFAQEDVFVHLLELDDALVHLVDGFLESLEIASQQNLVFVKDIYLELVALEVRL